MFYVYRLNELVDHERCFIDPLDHERCFIDPRPLPFHFPTFLKLIEQIGWDGTWTGRQYHFAIPMSPMTYECVAIQEIAHGRWFIGSPVELSWLNDVVDFDGRTDSQEVMRVTQAMQGGKPLTKSPPIKITRHWRVNDKGNLSAAIEGLNVCVVKSKSGAGYVGMIFGNSDGAKLVTPVLQTTQAAQTYLHNNFTRMIKAWDYKDDASDEDPDEQDIIFRPLG